MAFHVFVEGATDDTPAGVQRLANAIAQHYGLPVADLLARLQKGRFRVKGNVERELADTYRRDLERLGARCVIESADADNSARATPVPFSGVRPASPPARVPAAAAAAAAARGPVEYQSGLAAAFSSTPSTTPTTLGALDGENAAFALASVDGADAQSDASAGSFEPPANTLPASIGPSPSATLPASIGPPPSSTLPASIGPPPGTSKPTTSKLARVERPKDIPLDLFAPPDAADAQFTVDIADDEPLRRRSDAAAPSPAAVPAEPPTRRSMPSIPSVPSVSSVPSVPSVPAKASVPSPPARVTSATSVRNRLGVLGDLRVRFAAGVLLAVLVGFVPAHLVASMRERSAYSEIDQRVIATQALADTPETYAQLDSMRADQLERKRGEQRNTAIIALAVWALVGGAVAFAWFKKLPWQRFE